jgi:hypothetical protein
MSGVNPLSRRHQDTQTPSSRRTLRLPRRAIAAPRARLKRVLRRIAATLVNTVCVYLITDCIVSFNETRAVSESGRP